MDHRLYGNQTLAVVGVEEEGAVPSWDSGRGLLVSAAAASVFTVRGSGHLRVLEKEGSPPLSPHHPPPLLSTPPSADSSPFSALSLLLLFSLSLFLLSYFVPLPHPPPR